MFQSNERTKSKYRLGWIIPFTILALVIAWFVFYVLF